MVVLPNSNFCEYCGIRLDLQQQKDAEVQHLEGETVTQKPNGNRQLLCVFCGNALPEKAEMCMRCGRPVSDEGAIKRWAKRQKEWEIRNARYLVQSRAAQPQYAQTPQQPPSTDIPEQIRKLAQLKEEGILTEEEFQVQKQKLLSRM